MKKYLLITALIASAMWSTAQKPLMFTDVIKVDSASSKELYLRAKRFIIDHVSSKTLIDDKDDGQIVAKGNLDYEPGDISYKVSIVGKVSYSISIYCKDGRYKYEITDFVHNSDAGYVNLGQITEADTSTSTSHKDWYNKAYKDIKHQTTWRTQLLIEKLNEAMKKPSGTGKSDW